MDRIQTVKVSSRRSVTYKGQYLTNEMTLEANTEGMSDDEKKEYIAKMWEYAGSEVDNQLQDAILSIKGDNANS